MATRGTEWLYNKNEIIEALKEAKGRTTVACKRLGVHYETLVAVIKKEPELEIALKNLRESFENTILDMAESTIQRAMATLDDPNNALKAAMYTLNSRGRIRGWDNTYSNQDQKVVFEVNYKNDIENPVQISSENLPNTSLTSLK